METQARLPDLAGFFGGLRPGAAVAFGDLTLVPLLGPDLGADADLLEEGISSGRTVITEAGSGGTVGEVRVTHRGGRPLLLVDGEQIVGAKQNRVVNASFVLFPGADVSVPVSCVEQRRWRDVSRAFSSSNTTITSSARSSKVRRVVDSVTSTGRYDADQVTVWADISDYLGRSHVSSPTMALDDGLRSRREQVERDLERVPFLPEQVGLAALLAGRLLQLDAFGSRELCGRGWRKVARGVLSEAHPATPGGGEDPLAAVARVLEAAARIDTVSRSAPGGGDTLAGTSPLLAVSAICHRGRLYHAVVVPN